ncbi:MAG: hypothetical protein ACU0C9_07265 [Paracoccaceae bacterium]
MAFCMISKQQITDFQKYGAIVLRGVFVDWVDTMAAEIERNLANPGP